MNESGNIHDRLSKLVEVFGEGRNTVFARLIGESEANIRGYRANVLPKQPLLEKIARNLDISSDWLLTGRGEMLNEPRKTAPLAETGMQVPYYHTDLHTLFLRAAAPIPDSHINFPPLAAADYWADVTGHSMEPLISHGDIVALRLMDDWQSYFLSGEIYCIVTEEYSTIKRVRTSRVPDMLLLEPLNPDYDIQEIPYGAIKRVWRVLGCAKRF